MCTLVLWGIWGFLPKLTTMYMNPMSAVVFEVAGGMIVAVSVLFILGFRPELDPRGMGYAVLTGIVGLLGALGYLMALKRGKVSVVVTRTALYPVISITLAHFILHEPITPKEWVAIALACAAIGLFAI
jgi:transporter family protein